ncbi:Rv2175c family DNA-binding protein [Cellulomonas biazotea]|uniref:Transcriptional regulator n=1 Tax=Cellulomonas biazotea TaxID=1709 RepID=A0A402DPA3_9CELL|nr:Rv2175c family DNA-binding protein [Cellulomonas biazotea]GCE75982.1 transcriptional regulator [Cellulomonas biazotea]
MNDSTPAPDDLVDEWLTLPDVAERTGLDVSKVRRLLQERKLVAVRRGEPRVLSVPAQFLVPGHLANPAQPTTPRDDAASTVLASLHGTLTVLADAGFSDEEAVTWLFTPDESLPGTPVDALRAGRKTEVRRRAQAEL